MKRIPRADARRSGMTKYFTGNPCKHGHIVPRYTANGLCVTCAVRVNLKSRSKRRSEIPVEVRQRQSARVALWRAANHERSKELSRRSQRKGRANKPMQYRAYRWKAAGMPSPTRPTPLACECCGKQQTRKALALDHCHNSKRFRGWLCDACNLGIGRLGDTLSGVLLAVAYLQRAETAS